MSKNLFLSKPGNWKHSVIYKKLSSVTASSQRYLPTIMPSNALILRNPPRGVEDPRPQVVVDALIHLIQNQFPAIISGAAISAALIQQVVDFVKKNLAILGGVLTTAGLTILLPSLTVALVNLVGFSASGVVSGSLRL